VFFTLKEPTLYWENEILNMHRLRGGVVNETSVSVKIDINNVCGLLLYTVNINLSNSFTA